MEGTCRECVDKCPVNSLHFTPKDITLCHDKESVINREYNKIHYGIDVPSCGLCMIKLPCSVENPMNNEYTVKDNPG